MRQGARVPPPSPLPTPLQARLARLWRLLAVVLILTVVGLSALLHVVGQNHYLVAPLCYLPRAYLGVLLLLLAAPGRWWGPKHAAVLASAGVFYLAVLLEWRTPRPPAPPADPSRSTVEPELRAAFVNWGDHDPGAWVPWVKRLRPDLVALTDVRGREGIRLGDPATAGLPFLLRIGEHVLASRYPFSGSQIVRPTLPAASSVRVHYLPAARFQVEAPGGPVAVYVVHLRSPRDALSKYRQARFWRWTWTGVPTGVHAGNTLSYYWEEQRLMLDALTAAFRAETLPVLVLGDWNLPDFGPRYRDLTRHLWDAHREAGRGYGYTFPGDVTVPGAFGQPWMRIDYVLTDRQHWEILDSQVQSPFHTSQHRGLFTRLRRVR